VTDGLFLQVDDETDPIARKLGVEAFPGVVGLLSNGDQVSPSSSNTVLNKNGEALRGFLEGLEKKEHAAAESSQSEEFATVTLLTKSNMQHLFGPTSSLCIIGVAKSNKQQKRVKEILTEVGFSRDQVEAFVVLLNFVTPFQNFQSYDHYFCRMCTNLIACH
jgi:hypothetical protein